MMDTIAHKIKNLRTSRKLSQQTVADAIGVSRASYSQIETGQRKIAVEELHRVAVFFEQDLNTFFVSEKKPPQPDNDPHYVMKQVILYLSNRLADKPNYGETLLNKLLYFVDFDYFEWTGELVTGETYLKLPYGPVPQDIEIILDEMEADEKIVRKSEIYHGHPQKKIKAVADPDMTVFQKIDEEMQKPLENYQPYDDLPTVEHMIDSVISKYGSWTATAVSERSHRDLPWKSAQNIGDKLTPDLVFYRDEAFVANHHNLHTDD